MKKTVEIILRTCTNNNVLNDTQFRRFINVSKLELVIKCIKSLIISINNAINNINIFFTILDDHSDDKHLHIIKKNLESLKCDYRLISLSNLGYNNSALEQFKYSKNSECDFVYCVEDDYLHESNAIFLLYKDLNKFKLYLNSLIAIHPFDDPFSYIIPELMCSSKIVMGETRHYRTNVNSTNTFFSEPIIFKQYWNLFEQLALGYGNSNITEANTVNLLWNNGVDKNGPVYLFTPIPSLAVHISYNNKPFNYDIDSLWKMY